MKKEPDYKGLCLSMLSDLAYAVGYADGLGHKSDYLNDRYSALTEILIGEDL